MFIRQNVDCSEKRGGSRMRGAAWSRRREYAEEAENTAARGSQAQPPPGGATPGKEAGQC